MPNPITLNDAINLAFDYNLINLHTAMPASIIEYDFTKQKATVQPLLNKSWADGTSTPYLPLENVPVIFPKSGGASLTFPVNQGDTCLLIFIERSTDLWLTVGGQVTPDDNRKFDLSDAVAIMGLFPFSESSQAQNNDDLLLTYNGSSFRIKKNGDIVIETDSKIAIGSSLVEVLETISQTLADIAAITTTVIVPSTPFTGAFPINNAALFTALKTQIDSIKGTIP